MAHIMERTTRFGGRLLSRLRTAPSDPVDIDVASGLVAPPVEAAGKNVPDGETKAGGKTAKTKENMPEKTVKPKEKTPKKPARFDFKKAEKAAGATEKSGEKKKEKKDKKDKKKSGDGAGSVKVSEKPMKTPGEETKADGKTAKTAEDKPGKTAKTSENMPGKTAKTSGNMPGKTTEKTVKPKEKTPKKPPRFDFKKAEKAAGASEKSGGKSDSDKNIHKDTDHSRNEKNNAPLPETGGRPAKAAKKPKKTNNDNGQSPKNMKKTFRFTKTSPSERPAATRSAQVSADDAAKKPTAPVRRSVPGGNTRKTFLFRAGSAPKKAYTVGFVPSLALYAAVFALCLLLHILEGGSAFDALSADGRRVLFAGLYTALLLLVGILCVVLGRREGDHKHLFKRFSVHCVPFVLATALFALGSCVLYRFAVELNFPVADAFGTLAYGSGTRLVVWLCTLVTALAEELFFRGVLQSALTRVGGGLAGVILSALTFALCAKNGALFGERLLLGLLLAVLCHMCASMFPSLIVRLLLTAAEVRFGARIGFIAAERAGNTLATIVLGGVVLLLLIGYFHAASSLCRKKALSVETASSGRVLFRFYREPPRMTASGGYTPHRFFRLLLSPAVFLSAIVFAVYVLR